MEKVMSKIGKTAIKTYRCAAEGAGRLAHEIKLKAQMADNKSQIQELYESIGKKVYEKHILQESLNIETDFEDDCAMIDVLASEIEDIRMEILNLKDLKQCTNCHCEIELEYNYCPNCGKIQSEEKQNEPKATIETTDETANNLKKVKPERKIENVKETSNNENKEENIQQNNEE